MRSTHNGSAFRPRRSVQFKHRQVSIAVYLAVAATASQAASLTEDIQQQERLSHWLLRQGDTQRFDLHALGWYALADIPLQARGKDALVGRLQTTHPSLSQWISKQPVTGRVTLPYTDARWLQVHPEHDPILNSGDRVLLPERTEGVTILKVDGTVCQVRFSPGVSTYDYVRACTQNTSPDVAWVIQPDGIVQKQGLQSWNEGTQTPPAPGAWIWAPDRGAHIDAATSEALGAFLATQSVVPSSGNAAPQPPDAGQAMDLRDLPLSTNDWGITGLWQTPTARFGAAGLGTATFSRVDPYTNMTVQLQPFDWLSGAFRYTNVLNQKYGPSIAGEQTYKDKSVDIKVRLLTESHWLPQVAVGWRDLLGTGLFSGEYLVGSKRTGDWDFSLGMGWGYVGGRGNISNPLGNLSDKFNSRPTSTVRTGGTFNAKAYFRGPAALFGGFQYHLPWDGWIIKAEYDGNGYQREPFGTTLPAASPINVGVVWRAKPWLDLSVGYERGNTLMFAISTRSQLDGLNTPKVLDAPRVPVLSKARPVQGGAPERAAKDIEAQTPLRIAAIEHQDRRWTAVAVNPNVGYVQPALERTFAVMHRDAPSDVDDLSVRFEQRGAPLAEVSVDRDRWARSQSEYPAESQREQTPRPSTVTPPSEGRKIYEASSPSFDWGPGLSYRQMLGGPDAFLLYQLAADLSAEWRPRKDTWVTGAMRFALIDNFDRFRYTAPSELPRVRTLVREYAVGGKATIPNLQITRFNQWGDAHFTMLYGGLLEAMYAGVGGEYLYRPLGARLAVGLDVNRVQQRDFSQKFEMRDYKVSTGHATVYWETGWQGVTLKGSIGQYLAGDRGVTLEASRTFSNGVSIGAWATKTNVSAQQFGEGSFDKGVYVRIPFDAIFPRSGAGSAALVYSPLIRDGGAKLARRYSTYELTKLSSPAQYVR